MNISRAAYQVRVEVDKERLGRAVAVRRTELGLSRRELADAIGVSYPYLSEIETGNKYPSLTVLIEFAAGLDLSLSDLFSRVENLPERKEFA